MKRYLSMPDTRPVDVWGRPIGRSYTEKAWEDLTPDEMAADFDWKSDILAVFGEEVGCETFYQDYLFRELYSGDLAEGYKVLLTEYDAKASNKIHKIDVDEIQDFLHLNDVAISPCLFYSNWRRKALLNYVSAFVLDIDRLRPMQLHRFFQLFDEGRLLKPTFISNSGSGVHFYYLLDRMLRCDAVAHEANNLIAEVIYKSLYDDVIKKEKWTAAQRHWIGQDYRVVNSRTKFDQVARIYKVGDVYTIEDLVEHYEIEIDAGNHYATKPMVSYASGIAKDLGIEPPDYSDAKATYQFIRDNKDAAYLAREQRREARRSRAARRSTRTKPGTWYKNTLAYMRDNTEAGFRFSAMKALAIIAYKESVPEDIFFADLRDLAAYWASYNWQGDRFNSRNVEAIERLYRNAASYANTSSETLEEWLGYTFKRIGNKRNGRKQSVHLKLARGQKAILKDLGEMRPEGRPIGSGTKKQEIMAWRQNHPDGKPAECIRETGISKNTVYKWWDAT